MLDILKVKKLNPKAKLPVYATKGSACFDIFALTIDGDEVSKCISHGAPIKIGTGLAFEIPEGYCMEIHSRSGHGFKNLVRLANATGIIDSDYRGELMVKLVCDDTKGERMTINVGDRIAQGKLVKIEQVSFLEVDELSSTERGDGGFGSTGTV